MKYTTHAIVMFCLLLVAVSSAQALTYHVAPISGSDDRTCTEAQTISTPKKTLASVFTCLGTAVEAGAGDTVSVTEAGTFTETSINNIPSGAAVASFTFKNDSGGTVTIRPPTGTGQGVLHLRTSSTRYIVIDGFVFDGINRVGNMLYIDSGIGTDSFVTIKNSTLINGGLGRVTNDSGAIITASNRNTFDNLDVYDNGNASNLDHGIYIASAFNTVRNSRIYNNCARGVKIDSNSDPITSNDNLVHDNLI